jgi:hypothetical protein
MDQPTKIRSKELNAQAADLAEKPKQESMLANLVLNIILPTLILVQASGENLLGPKWAVVVALSFPLGYGAFDFNRTRKVNLFSALGVISVILTGGISLLELPAEYMAIKEAAIPGLIGLITIASLYTKYPLVRTFLFNPKLMQTDKVQKALELSNNTLAFEKTLSNASYMLAASFFLSSILNYILATVVLVSPPGTEAYNAELGKMTALSFPVITVPSTIVLIAAMYYLFTRITKLTHLTWDDILIQPENPDDTSQTPVEKP